MKRRMLAALALVCVSGATARAQQYVEITSLPQATATYRVAAFPVQTTPAPALPPHYGYAQPPVRYEGAPVTTYRSPGVVQAGYAPTVACSPVSQPMQPVPANLTYIPANGYGAQQPPYRPIVSLSSAPTNGIVGQGILGQPKLYMPSQPVRNFVRWLMP